MLSVAFLLGLGAVFEPCVAHDHEKPELNDWFMHLHSGKGMCCDGSEAIHLSEVDWTTKNGHYRVTVPATAEEYARARAGEDTEHMRMIWVDVPDDAVIEEPNKEGTALVWPVYSSINGNEVTIWIRCFMPGSGT